MHVRTVVQVVIMGSTICVGVVTGRLSAQTLAPAAPTPTLVPAAAQSDLTLRGSVSGGYDINAVSDANSSINVQNPLFRGTSTHVGGDVQLQYSSAPSRRFNFAGGWGSSFRLYQAADLIPISHSGAFGLSAGLTPHLNVQASVGVSFAPRYQFDLLPAIGASSLGQVSAPPLDYALTIQQVLSYTTGVAVSYQPTRRTSFTLGYDFQDVNADRVYFAGRTQGALAGVHVNLTKGLGVRLGYRYQLSHYLDAATGIRRPVRGDNLDVGLDYGLSRGLTLSRSTKLTFRGGTGAFSDGHVSRIRLVGNANLAQHIFRTWDLGVAYARGMSFVDGFAAPIFSDAVNARLHGQLTRRLSAYGLIGYSFGGIDDLTTVSRYHSYRSQVGLQAAMTRQLNAFVQYVNYVHAFEDSSLLIQGAPAHLNRQGVQVGVSFGVPLLRGRRAQQPPSGMTPPPPTP